MIFVASAIVDGRLVESKADLYAAYQPCAFSHVGGSKNGDCFDAAFQAGLSIGLDASDSARCEYYQ